MSPFLSPNTYCSDLAPRKRHRKKSHGTGSTCVSLPISYSASASPSPTHPRPDNTCEYVCVHIHTHTHAYTQLASEHKRVFIPQSRGNRVANPTCIFKPSPVLQKQTLLPEKHPVIHSALLLVDKWEVVISASPSDCPIKWHPYWCSGYPAILGMCKPPLFASVLKMAIEMQTKWL